MLRPRRAKQRPVQSHEIVGLLPSEEAAIQRALMASIARKPTTKESPPEGKASSKLSSPPTKKFKKSLSTSPKLPNTTKYSRSTTPNSLSTSPFSLSSNISFLSTDSVSSNPWTPSPVAKTRGRPKGSTKKKQSPSRKPGRPKSVSPRSSAKSKSKTPSPKRQVAIKSVHRAKATVQKRRAKLIACAVRKKAADEPRNEAGLTVDEILKSVANMRDSSISPKLKPGRKPGPKPKSSPKSPPSSRGSKSRQNSPSSAKSTPKRSLGKSGSKSPTEALKSPTSLKLTTKLTLKLSKSSLNLTTPKKTDSKTSGQSSDCACDESAKQKSPSQSPNSYSYQAQRKYASNHSPPFRSSNQELASPPGLKETPKTEDFLHFLCLRGSNAIPDRYKKFDFPWTPIKQAQVKNSKETNSSRKLNRDKPATALGLTAKKLDFNAMARIEVN